MITSKFSAFENLDFVAHPIIKGAPLSDEELNSNFNLFRDYFKGSILEESLRKPYLELLDFIARDRNYADTTKGDNGRDEETISTYVGLIKAPAASGHHHDYTGGLVIHMLQMLEHWNLVSSYYPQIYKSEGFDLDDQTALRAVLHHNLHKAFMTFVWDAKKCSYRYGQNPHVNSLSTDAQSLWLLNRHQIPLSPHLMSIHSVAEGGWSKNPGKDSSVMAKICYLLDEFSGNVIERIISGKNLSVRGTFRGPIDDYWKQD